VANVRDLAVNLAASVVAGTAVWLAQLVLRHRRLARKRAFFGLPPGSGCMVVVPRHASSPRQHSVHDRDVAALVELATVARECGSRAEVVTADDAPEGIGRLTEFCIGGPLGNARSAAHLRSLLPGVEFETYQATGEALAFRIGATGYRRAPEEAEFVVLAKAYGPAMAHPVFLLAGQTARTNLAAARFLSSQYRELVRKYGESKGFCLVLRIAEPATYGSDFVEVVADATDDAFRSPESPKAEGGGAGEGTEAAELS
jgi:hypothetical protein